MWWHHQAIRFCVDVGGYPCLGPAMIRVSDSEATFGNRDGGLFPSAMGSAAADNIRNIFVCGLHQLSA